MKAIRLGNDIEFVWTVEGLTNVLGTKLVQLFNVNKGIPETMTYEISGDNITGLYKGKNQKEKGSYRLILYVNRGENDMVTLDCVNAFELVGVSNFGIVNGSDESAITIATINLRSTLDAAPTIPSIQAQADWEEDDDTKVDFIKNKPDLFSGDYEDLTNKPTIPDAQIQSDWNQSDSSKNDYIKNKPTIPVVPTNVSEFNNDAGYINDVSDKQDVLVSGTNIKTINNQSLLGSGNINIQGGGGSQVQSDWNETDTDDPAYIKNKPTIPSEVTESTVAGWGFTKNTGDYSKPSGGIPSTDLSSAVQTSLGKADTAIQTETDPTVPSWAKANSKPSYTASEVGAVPTTRKVNGKALSSDVTLTASDVGALPDDTTIPTITFIQW